MHSDNDAHEDGLCRYGPRAERRRTGSACTAPDIEGRGRPRPRRGARRHTADHPKARVSRESSGRSATGCCRRLRGAALTVGGRGRITGTSLGPVAHAVDQVRRGRVVAEVSGPVCRQVETSLVLVARDTAQRGPFSPVPRLRDGMQ